MGIGDSICMALEERLGRQLTDEEFRMSTEELLEWLNCIESEVVD